MIKSAHIAAHLFHDMIWYMGHRERKIYLTFDDGPTAETTPWVLSLLREYQAKATFFCLGRNADRHPELFARIVAEGHAVGNHTYSHLKGWNIENEEYFNDVELATQHIPTNLFRPPYGRIRPSQISSLKQQYHLIMWDVLSRDYDSSVTPERCLQTVLNFAEAGSIVVFHDSFKASRNMMYALPRTLSYFKSLGYEFAPIRL